MALRQCRSHDLPGLPSTAMMNQTLGHWDESLIKERLGEEWHKELASRGFSILGGHDKYVWKHDKDLQKTLIIYSDYVLSLKHYGLVFHGRYGYTTPKQRNEVTFAGAHPNVQVILHKIHHQHHSYQLTHHQISPRSRNRSQQSTISVTHFYPQHPPSTLALQETAATIIVSLANNNPKTMIGTRTPCSPPFTAAR
ncbi:hypothetical protein GOBAR_AA34177 [Gossypium barbadense]|uniref:Uncharacterized protein n=1 Tax=Gossypium barbadense TaxID=3634 RepID=A0A2P5W600_GOSBA|nr:hypothetical protein GOBAR_AA34177 [Gossypium barbadense]